MYSNTHYGDYPRYAPDHPTTAGQHCGWMLLSYNGKTTVSTSKEQIKKVPLPTMISTLPKCRWKK